MTVPTGLAEGRAEHSSSYAAAMVEDDVEIQLVRDPHCYSEARGVKASGAPCRALRRSVLSLGAVAAGACAVVLLHQQRWSRPSPAPKAADTSAMSGLWSPMEESGPCPRNEVCQGHGCGIPRTPLFYTVGQAFHCLDTDGNLELTKEEIDTGGRGGASTGSFIAKDTLQYQIAGNGALSFYWFQDGMRQYRDRMFLYEPAVSEKIVHWVEQVRKMLPAKKEEEKQELPPYSAPDPAVGTVDHVFTFGAPSISKEPLWNAAREDGCFPGVRIYNSGTELIKEYKLRMHITDPIPWILTEIGFEHYRTNALSLHEDSLKNQGFMKCGSREEPSWVGPRSDMFFWFEGHKPSAYEDNLKALSELIHPSDDAALDWERKTGPDGRIMLESSSASSVPGIYAGDQVMLKENATLVRHAFLQVDLPFTQEIEDTIGKTLRVLRVRRPGVLAVRPLGYGEGSEWDCAQAALMLVRRVKVVQAGSSAEDAPTLEAHEGATGINEQRLEQLAKVREAAHLAMLSYNSVSEVNADLKGRDWKFLGRGSGGGVSVTFLQNEKTLDCVLTFGLRGVDEEKTHAEFDPVNPMGHGDNVQGRLERPLVNFYQFFAARYPMLDQHKVEKLERNVRTWREPFYEHLVEDELLENRTYAMVSEATNVWRAHDFCGFKEVQHHIHGKMIKLINSPNFEDVVTSHLESCQTVTSTGHSLGGALAALWAACVNRGLKPGEDGYEEYERLSWKKGTPERLPSIVSTKPTSIVVKDTSTNMGIGIAGSLSAAAAGDGTLQLSPFVDEGWQEQWQLTPEGYLKNPHSGKCLGVASHKKGEALGTEVQLQTCKQGEAGRDQRWALLRSHVLAHKYTGRCLDGNMKLSRCPLTDQRWHLTAEGFIVNRISGKCVDVVGDPGTENGAKLVQWPCEYNSNTTDQLWEFTATGQVRNKLSGKCIEVANVQGKQHGALWQSNLVLWDCARENTTYSSAQRWAWSDNGFMVNMANGKCVDVYGGVDGTDEKPDGTDLVVGSCQRTFPQSAAMWQLTPDNYLINIGRIDAFRNMCVAITKDEEDAPLKLQECETGMRHNWELDETGHIQTTLGFHVCIGADGDNLNLTECDQNNTAQMWSLTEEGFLVNSHSQKCIDITPYDMTLRQDHCHMTDQRWIVRPSGAIRSRLSGLCMDVQGSPPNDMQAGTPLSIWECEHDRAAFDAGVASSDQIWEITYEKTIRNKLTGMCVDIEGDEKTKMYNGANVVVQPCDNSTAQHWDLDLDGFFRNRLSGKCIDVKGPAGHHRGQLLVMYTCETNPDFSNQIWSFAKAATGRTTSPKLPFAVAPRRYATGWSDSSGKGYVAA